MNYSEFLQIVEFKPYSEGYDILESLPVEMVEAAFKDHGFIETVESILKKISHLDKIKRTLIKGGRSSKLFSTKELFKYCNEHELTPKQRKYIDRIRELDWEIYKRKCYLGRLIIKLNKQSLEKVNFSVYKDVIDELFQEGSFNIICNEFKR